jgi:hypothetical protein
MARLSDEQRRDQERLRVIRKIEERAEPKFRKPATAGTYLLLLLVLAIVGAAVFYVAGHKEWFLGLFKRAPKPAAVETEDPGPGDGRF